jgi:polyisoprenyl-phosphate glycosyltransferase
MRPICGTLEENAFASRGEVCEHGQAEGTKDTRVKSISIVTPCYNEEDNVRAIHEQVQGVMGRLSGSYTYEHIFIDNASSDRTVSILKEIASRDKHLKIIVNARNFGHLRSPFYGLLQTRGDAVISLVADLQDPPEMIVDFIKKWEEGYKIVVGVKKDSEESRLLFAVRSFYYNLINRLADIQLIKNFTGFGLYDRSVIEVLRGIDEPYPYFRGMICDIGFERAELDYVQPVRKRGVTKNGFYTLFDLAMLGMTNHSKVPLRLATMLGFLSAVVSLLAGVFYLAYKILFWNRFAVGQAPLVLGLFFFASVQLFFLGIVGEYIGAIHTQVRKRPLVIEKERINFDSP